MTALPDVTFSEEGDILYVTLSDSSISTTRAFGDERLVDFDSSGQVVGAEFIGVSDSIDLRGLPETVRIRNAIETHGTFGFKVLIDPIEVHD